jgi:hypothetical protein
MAVRPDIEKFKDACVANQRSKPDRARKAGSMV